MCPNHAPCYHLVGKKPRDLGDLVRFKNNKHLLFSFQFQCPEATVNRFSVCKSFHSSKARGIKTAHHLQSIFIGSALGLVILLAWGQVSGSGGKRSVGFGTWCLAP